MRHSSDIYIFIYRDHMIIFTMMISDNMTTIIITHIFTINTHKLYIYSHILQLNEINIEQYVM